MNVMTIVGTRPEIIRLSRIIPLLDKYTHHTLLHTGQNYDPNLKDIFFDELGIRKPDWEFNLERGKPFETIGEMLKQIEIALTELDIDKVLILGDTNSGLSAMVAKRFGIPVLHMEAGNRCFSDEVPEEVNRRIIDTCSDILMPYTERSRQNLLREGFPSDKIFVTGNPIGEVLDHYQNQIKMSNVLHQLEILPRSYYLVTLHRAENIKDGLLLHPFNQLLRELSKERPVIVSVHPHTMDRLSKLVDLNSFPRNVYLHEPFGFIDFVHLEQNAYAVLTDSGTVQEECAIFGIPSVTLRNVTERPEVIESGSGCLTGISWNKITNALRFAVDSKPGGIPDRYMDLNVSTTVMKIILGRR